MSKLIMQGAEAKIFKQDTSIIKERIPKLYRFKELDKKLRKQRTKKEAKILEKAAKIINTPKLISTDEKQKIEMSFIKGDKLSETLNSYKEQKQIQVMHDLGKEVAKLHDNDIIHNDLTTSNIILTKENLKKNQEKVAQIQNQLINKNKLFIIDFGLSFISKRLEDKAVDLHLIKQALEAKHWQNCQELYNSFIQAYNPKDKLKILEQLKKVESRGRYKH